MEGIVVDASVAMVWCYPDEHSEYAYRVLDALEHRQVIVPSLWAVEVANALIVGQRRRRLTAADAAHFLDMLEGLSIETDLETASHALVETRALAEAHGLSAYDATYLELAMREALPLATLDERLRTAADAVGAVIFAEVSAVQPEASPLLSSVKLA